MDPTSAAMYQEMIAQQMKAMANSGNIPPAAGLSPMQLQPNPLMMQWLWYIQQQQAAYQQQQQQSLLQMEAGPGRAPLHQGPPPPPRGPEMMNYPQAPLQSVPVPGAVDQEGLKQGFTSPGLFIPPMAPEQQRRHQQQMLSKPKSQAIPILPPKVSGIVANPFTILHERDYNTVDREFSPLINFRQYPMTMKIKNAKNFQHRITALLHLTKIKQHENLRRKIL